jgi:hypothetical protein
LDRYTELCCLLAGVFDQSYHWSLMEVEYATDLAFRSGGLLKPVYEQLIRQTMLAVRAEQIAAFLGWRITPQLAQEVGSFYAIQRWGTCARHRFGKIWIKIYDKVGIVLRIETSANDVSFFKHHRRVKPRNRPPTMELTEFRNTIYSLADLREIMPGCNHRYLAHLSALEDFSGGGSRTPQGNRVKE